MRLCDLILRSGLDVTLPFHDVDITAVTDRSSNAIPGSLFVAVEGVAVNGHNYIQEAVDRGAVAVIGGKEWPADTGSAIYIRCGHTRRALARLLHAFSDFPMNDMLVVGITGTNGKSTTAYLVESILAAAGYNAGLIGTIEYRYGGESDIAAQTTPHPAVLVEYANRMRRAGVNALAMEVSSHALVQERVEGVPFRVAVLTNVTQDHFDFHGTHEAYIDAKWRMFGELLTRLHNGVAVFNLDDQVGVSFHERYPGRALTYGRHPKADVRPLAVESDREGTRVRVEIQGESYWLRSRLCGDYNVANLLAATAVGIAVELPADAIVAGAESLPGVPGRFERIEVDAPFDVYIDFAHTPDALEHVLTSARRLLPDPGRLICVFGAGGDRDTTKRKPMGAAVARHADRAIIAKDNCRTEPPQQIAAALAAGIESVEGAKCRYDIILDRGDAIRTALSEARPGDIVLLAGKGHELYENEGGELRPWDDRQVVRESLTGLQ